MQNIDPALRELLERIDDDYRQYRQSGLGVSATTILLFGALWQSVSGGLHCPSFREVLIVLWIGVVALGVTAALLVQVFHYFGYKCFAERWFAHNGDGIAWATQKKSQSDRMFNRAHLMVWSSVGLLATAGALSIALCYAPK